MDWYKKIPNGYSGLTNKISYGKKAGIEAEKIILQYYKKFSKIVALP